ncbi:MAG: tetratricopeptide repeat protein [Candidatus Brocadia sp.]|nr:tetratricopeptide repeat protein [Candidatus Brocadia sp.]
MKSRYNTRFVTHFFSCILLSILSSNPSYAEKSVKQETAGSQSPAIVTGGEVTINYGVSQEMFNTFAEVVKGNQKTIDRFLKILEEKNIDKKDRDEEIQKWVERYNELQAQLASRTRDDTLGFQAKEKLNAGDLEGVEKLLQESLKQKKQHAKKNKTATAADYYVLGLTKELDLNYEQARQDYEQAIKYAPQNSKYLNKYGEILLILGNSKDAIKYFNDALNISRKVYGEDHPDVATIHCNIGEASYNLHQLKDAEDNFKKALEIDLKVYGQKQPNHPNIARDYNYMGLISAPLHGTDRALEYYKKALEINRQVYGEVHPAVATNYNNMGLALASSRDINDINKAIEYYDKAIDINKKVYGDKHPAVANNYNNMSSALGSLDKPDEAIGYLEKALDINIKAYGQEHLMVATNYCNFGLMLCKLDKRDEAIEYLKKALEIYKSKCGDKDPGTMKVKSMLDAGSPCNWEQPSDQGMRKATIFVENLAGNFYKGKEFLGDKEAVLEEFITSRITEQGFSIVNQETLLSAFGSPNNKEPSGTKQDSGQRPSQGAAVGKAGSQLSNIQKSAGVTNMADFISVQLAQSAGVKHLVDYIIVASIASFGSEKKTFKGYGVMTENIIYNLRVSYKILDAGYGGGTLVADTVKVSKTTRFTEDSQNDNSDIINELLDEAAIKVAESLSKKQVAPPQARPELVEITIVCGMQDLAQLPIGIPDIRVDKDNKMMIEKNTLEIQPLDVTVELNGVVIGSAPGTFKVSPGLGRIGLSREGFKDWERAVNLIDGLKLKVALQMNDEGYRRWKDNTDFLYGFKRDEKLTDAEIEKIKGIAQLFRQSGYKVDIKQDIKVDTKKSWHSVYNLFD